MPGMDGIETATFLRAGRGRFTPIIFVSAYENTPFEVERGYLAGAIDYLFSPVDADLLKRKVGALVDFYLRNQEFKKRNESLVRANQALLKKVASLEQEMAASRVRWPAPATLLRLISAHRVPVGRVPHGHVPAQLFGLHVAPQGAGHRAGSGRS
jgi:response regulator RpfG family c-di-GMP phosphodiesterase